MPQRLVRHAQVVGIAWPLLIVVAASVEATRLPYYSVTWPQAFQAALLGLVLLTTDVVIAGAAFCALSFFVFRRFGRTARRGVHLVFEPILLFAAIAWGASLWYPSLLTHLLFGPLAYFPVWLVTLIAGVLVVGGACLLGRPQSRPTLVIVLVAVGISAPVPALLAERLRLTEYETPALVILGLDSISQSDDVSRLREWIEDRDGTWYTRAVAPGLLTNPVWTSVLTLTPVHEHGVFHTFQSLGANEPRLLRAARAHGYHTVSLFSDQLTCAIGSDAGFDDDRSGPVGWRQLMLPLVQNASVLIPLWKPALPRIYSMAAPPNQAGTFTYSLRRDLREILRSGVAGRRVLAAAHLTYLHLPSYPRYFDLTWGEIGKVAKTTAASVRDRSFDWQDQDRASDPVPLRAWKLQNLQRIVTDEVAASGLVARGGRLVVFSDHGDRQGLTAETFRDPRFHHVILATINLPPRSPGAPVSLIDIASLAGLVDGRTVEDPAVEFVLGRPELWPTLVSSARLHWSGTVTLSPVLLSRMLEGLMRHEPWPASHEAESTGDGVSPAGPSRD